MFAPFRPALTNGDRPFNRIAREVLEFSAEAEIHHNRDVPQAAAAMSRTETITIGARRRALWRRTVEALLVMSSLLIAHAPRVSAMRDTVAEMHRIAQFR